MSDQSIAFIEDARLIWTHGQYYASGNNSDDNHTHEPTVVEESTKHVFLTQEEYDSLEEYEKDTIYFILEPEVASSWVFGSEFPITLT